MDAEGAHDERHFSSDGVAVGGLACIASAACIGYVVSSDAPRSSLLPHLGKQSEQNFHLYPGNSTLVTGMNISTWFKWICKV